MKFDEAPVAVDELRVPVGGGAGRGDHDEQAACLFVPPPGVEPVAVLVALPGASYDKRYWHLAVPGRTGYSFAGHLARRGVVVVAVDHLAVGESSDPTGRGTVDSALLAGGDAAVVEQVRARIRDGSLHPGLGGPRTLPVVVCGHSMGAALAVLLQAEHEVADGLVLLGYGVEITDLGEHEADAADLSERVRQNRGILADRFGADPAADFFSVPRSAVRELFFGPEVPADVVAADAAVACPVPLAVAADVGTPGFVRAAAARVTVPLLLAFGGRDTCADPLPEPSYYRAATDLTLRVFPTSHHCHNSAGCRADVFDAVADWVVGRFGGAPR